MRGIYHVSGSRYDGVVSGPTKTVELIAGEEHAKLRLDAFLARQFPWRSRRSVVDLLVGGAVAVNGRAAKKSHRLAIGDTVAVTVPVDPNAEEELRAINLDILHEDEDLVVVDKPRGLAVHPASTCMNRNLLTRLGYRYEHEVPDPSVQPLLVHRLDRTTSGVIVVAKRRALVAFYTGQFELRTTAKTYLAIVHGHPPDSGRVDLPILAPDQRPVEISDQGKPAHTRYDVVERGPDHAWIRVRIETGRTHQIRVHLAAIGHPLLGDDVYGDRPTEEAGAWLHAHRLELEHRAGGRVTFESAAPAAMREVWAGLSEPRAS